MASIRDFYNGNITSIDDRLLRASFTVGVGSLLLLTGFLNPAGNGSKLWLVWFLGIVIVSLTLLVAGFLARKREKRCVGLWRLMQTHPEIQLSLYLQQSGNSLADVKKAVRTINKAGAGMLVVDSVNDRLYDNRMAETESTTFECNNCGANSTASNLDDESAVCQYCHAPAPDGLISTVSERRESLVKSNTERLGLLKPASQHQSEKINIPILIALLVVFPPAAVVYVVKKAFDNHSKTPLGELF